MKNLNSIFFALAMLPWVDHLSPSHAQVPQITILKSTTGSVVLSWPMSPATTFLETADDLAKIDSWQRVTNQPVIANAVQTLVLAISTETHFFRLHLDALILPASDFEIAGYELVSSVPIDADTVEETYKVDVTNWGKSDVRISATLSSLADKIQVVAGVLNFPNVPAGATIQSSDSLIIRRALSTPFDHSALTWNLAASELPPTTFALIDKGLLEGRLNAEIALLYKVYDDFNDPRFPPAYKGRNDGPPEGTAMRKVESIYATLSTATRQLLEPYRLLPTDQGSWVDVQASLRSSQAAAIHPLNLHATTVPPHVVWGSVLTKNSKVQIAWQSELRPADEARAQAIADEIDGYLWKKLTDFMGEPLPIPGTETLRLVIYLEDINRPETKTLPAYDINGLQVCTGEPAPALIHLNPGASNSTLAHEMMHAIVFSYKLLSCSEPAYRWMNEATATWAEHFAYPLLNSEHGDNGRSGASSFLKDPTVELEFKDDDHEYGAYLWFFFLTRGVSSGNPPFVRETWQACAKLGSLAAIDSAIQSIGGFKKQWLEFALYNWNRTAEDGKPYRYYYDWDKLKQRAFEQGPQKLSLDGKSSGTEIITHEIPHLAANYFHYDFDFDMNIRTVDFKNPFYSGGLVPGAKVQAIVKIRNKDWQPAEDWTALARKRFCRDLPNEDIQQLVIVISNSAMDGPALGSSGPPPQIDFSSFGCDIWEGTITQNYTRTSSDSQETLTSEAKVAFIYDDAASEGGLGFPQIYTLHSGTYDYSRTVNFSFGQPCRIKETSSGPIVPNPYTPGVEWPTTASLTFIVGIIFPGETGVHFLGSGASEVSLTQLDNCNESGQDRTTLSDSWIQWWRSTDGEVSVDGKTIDSSLLIFDDQGGAAQWKWHLTHK